MKKILVLQGPNLNMLGFRETSLYGTTHLEALHAALQQQAVAQNYQLNCFQSNHEGALIDAVSQALADKVAFIIINPAAYTHTSIALRDALLAVAIPFIEIHITNIYQREAFRQQSYFSDIAQGIICGLGTTGYFLALEAAIQYLNHSD